MTQPNGHGTEGVNELERQMVGEPTVPARSGRFLPRYRRRRVDLMSLDGVLRESRRNYLEWRTGRIDAESYLVAVRGISSHKDILAAVEQAGQIRELQDQLAKLQQQGAGALTYQPGRSLADQPSDHAEPLVNGEAT